MRESSFHRFHRLILNKDVFLFVMGVLSLIKVKVMGTLALAELIVLFATFFIPWWRTLRVHGVSTLLKLAALWLLAVILSDAYNGTDFVNSMKGTFNVVLLIINIPFACWAFYDSPRRMLYYWLGVGIGNIIQFYLFSSYESEFEYDTWRVYAFDFFFLSVAGILYYKGRRRLGMLLAEGFAIWSLFHSSRNIFLCTTIANALLFYIHQIRKPSLAETLRGYKHRLILVAASLGVGALIASYAYEYTASHGLLGKNAYEKYLMQKNTEAGLASGRVDFLISWELIKDNPVWGYGSYAMDKDNYQERYYIRHGYYVHADDIDEDQLLPGHSYFLGAWVYSGILSVPFWLYVLYLVAMCLKRDAMLRQPRLMGLIVMLIMSYVWKILFSPFADRILFASFVVMLSFLCSDQYWRALPQSEGHGAVPSSPSRRPKRLWSRFR